MKFFFFLFTVMIASSATAGLNLSRAPKAHVISQLTQENFQIKQHQLDSKVAIIANLGPIEWVRLPNTLIVPRAQLTLQASLSNDEVLYLRYKDKKQFFQKSEDKLTTKIYISLYEGENVIIGTTQKIVQELEVITVNTEDKNITIDNSCKKYQLQIKNIEQEHMSVSCKLDSIGDIGSELPKLTVLWSSPDFTMVTSSQKEIFYHSGSIQRELLSKKSKLLKKISFEAKLPIRNYRLHTALGFGPYALNTGLEGKSDKKSPLAPSFFLYANYKVNQDNSFRLFNAAIIKDSIFDNAGLYLGSNFGYSFDNRLYFTTLLGIQYLYYKFDKDSPVISEAILPQGIEFMYKHAFDIPNYIISGGIFLSTVSEIEYENVWIRWGKNYFWELNLISWKKDDFEARTWGLSIGIPFKSFF